MFGTVLEQRLESLKLVHDDKVRLERVDTDLCDELAKLADNSVPLPSRILRPVFTISLAPGLEELVKIGLQLLSFVKLFLDQ